MSDSTEVVVPDTKFSTGAVRSAAVDHLDFTSMPLVGLLGVARTSAEGATKYGRLNYAKGMPIHVILNHVFGHYFMFLLGDRSEPHLEHAAWGALLASQMNTLDPGLSEPHLLGPGATLSPAALAFLDANAPELAEHRKAGAFNGIGNWNMRDLPEIQTLLSQRDALTATAPVADDEDHTTADAPKVRRKRRTKAEIEAAKASGTPEDGTPIDASLPATGDMGGTVDVHEPTDEAIAAMDAE